MALLKWIPFKDLLFLQERMSRVFAESLAKYGGMEGGLESAWTPPADIYETAEKIVVKVELAGIDINDVNVEINENTLTLKGERKLERIVKEEHFHRMECSYGVFQRVFTLPAAVDKDSVRANFKDGVLEIIVPKVKKPKAKTIKVEST